MAAENLEGECSRSILSKDKGPEAGTSWYGQSINVNEDHDNAEKTLENFKQENNMS